MSGIRNRKTRPPYYFSVPGDEYISFAGIFDLWKDEKGNSISTFSIVTTNANQIVGKIHNRMPVVLDPDEENPWLDQDTNPEDLQKIMESAFSGKMKSWEVTKLVNKPANNSPDLIRPI